MAKNLTVAIWKRFRNASVLFLIVVGVVSVFLYRLVALDAIREYGVYHIGGEILVVPVFVGVSYLVYKKTIYAYYQRKMENARGIILDFAESSKANRGVMFMEKGLRKSTIHFIYRPFNSFVQRPCYKSYAVRKGPRHAQDLANAARDMMVLTEMSSSNADVTPKPVNGPKHLAK